MLTNKDMSSKMKSNKKTEKAESGFPELQVNKIIEFKQSKMLASVVPVYGRDLVIIVGDPEEAETMLLWYFNPSRDGMRRIIDAELEDGYGTAFSFSTKENAEVFVIVVNLHQAGEPIDKSKVLSAGSHEAFHTTHQMMRFMGNKPIEESEEAYAYLHEYIFTKFLEVAV
jgi:hypothetical protein